MTARRNDNGDLEVVKIGGKTISYRTLLLALVISGTPAGDKVWSMVGLPREVTAPSLARLEKRVAAIEEKLDDQNDDIHTLTTRVTGFQIDFTKYKDLHP